MLVIDINIYCVYSTYTIFIIHSLRKGIPK